MITSMTMVCYITGSAGYDFRNSVVESMRRRQSLFGLEACIDLPVALLATVCDTQQVWFAADLTIFDVALLVAV